jgi:hypothetical protein
MQAARLPSHHVPTYLTSTLPLAGEATLGKGDLSAKGESLYVKDYKY